MISPTLTRWIVSTVVCFSSSICIAATFEKTVVTLENKTRVYAEIHRGVPGRATFVLVNGLIYDLDRWDPLARRLASEGYTVLRYSFSPQPESLRLLAENETPSFLKRGLELKDLADELSQVIENLGVKDRIHLVGLSYGASVAAEYISTHQERIAASIFISPLVVPLDFYDANGRNLRIWLNGVRFWEDTPCDLWGKVNPMLCVNKSYWYEQFYTYFYNTYLQERIQEPPAGVTLPLFKKSVFHLIRAARDFDLRAYASRLPEVHFLLAGRDEEHLQRDQWAAWNEVPKEERRSLFVFQGARHAIPDEAPELAAEVLKAIAEKLPETRQGLERKIPREKLSRTL